MVNVEFCMQNWPVLLETLQVQFEVGALMMCWGTEAKKQTKQETW